MTNIRLTNAILIVMLIMNIAFIGTWWMTKNKNHHSMMHHDMQGGGGMHDMKDKGMSYLTHQLNFTDDQQAKAEKLFNDHGDKMKKYQEGISRIQKEIVKCMTMDAPDSVHAFQYADSVGVMRIAMQKEFFRNSIAIRQICDADQKKKFDEMMQNMQKRLNRPWNTHGNSMNRDSL